MKVELKQEYRGVKAGKEIDVSIPMSKYLSSIGIIDKKYSDEEPAKKKSQSKTPSSKKDQPKDSHIQKNTAGK